MICESCSGLVLWDDSLTETRCQKCGAVNNQVLEADDYDISEDEDQEEESTTEPQPKDCRSVCQASRHDGIACPPDECDYETGVRKPTKPQPKDPTCPKST